MMWHAGSMNIAPRSMASHIGGQPSVNPAPGPVLRVLADTSVVLDLLLARQPWLSQAQPMWDARDAGRLFVHLPASALTDIFYICRKQVGRERALQATEACLQGFAIVAVDRSIVEAALSLPGKDFEDNIQIACAQAAGLDLIVTRNTADFAQSPVPAVEPLAVISRLSRSSP